MCVVHRHRKPQRSGLALVELLVVIVIIDSTVVLLLPAVQAARESGRRAQCRSNVRQHGTALLQHVSSHGTFAPGNIGRTVSKRLASIRPFIEQQQTYDDLDWCDTASSSPP